MPLLEEALAGFGDGDSALRARLLVRLACAVREQSVPARSEALSREAVEIARAVGDPATLVYTLMGRNLATWVPENLAELLEITAEIVQLADDAGEPERAADARLLRLEAHLIRGDMREVRADLDAASRLAAEARRPSARWHVLLHLAELAMFEGRFVDGERHIAEMLELGERAQVSGTAEAALVQRFVARWSVGGLPEIAGELSRLVEKRPAKQIFRCLLAVLDLESGNEEQARRTVDALAADEFAAVPHDEDWMLAVALLVELAAELRDVERAAVLYPMLEPYADLVVVDPHVFSTGSVARSLGVAASTCGRFEEAERHFLGALAMNERIGSLPWLARTQESFARMLLAPHAQRDTERALKLIERALVTYRALGMESYAARASSLAQEAVAQAL